MRRLQKATRAPLLPAKIMQLALKAKLYGVKQTFLLLPYTVKLHKKRYSNMLCRENNTNTKAKPMADAQHHGLTCLKKQHVLIKINVTGWLQKFPLYPKSQFYDDINPQ